MNPVAILERQTDEEFCQSRLHHDGRFCSAGWLLKEMGIPPHRMKAASVAPESGDMWRAAWAPSLIRDHYDMPISVVMEMMVASDRRGRQAAIDYLKEVLP